MLKIFTMWACLCATAPVVCAHEWISADSIACDSTADYSISPMLLDEVTVKAASVINKTDRRVMYPDGEMLRTSADGMDLLRKLQLSRITVNPLTNSVEVRGGGEVMLCINGVEATSAQIAAIRPEDIRRIEYHDSPGMRYDGAAVVIDYITSRHDSGGNLMVDAFGAFAKGRWASIDNMAGQYNQGRSVWTANVSYFGQRKDKWLRDYDETWHYPEAAVSRHEDGLPVSVGQHGLESAVNYNYLHPSGNVFNLRVGFDLNYEPEKEEGDRRAMLHISDAEEPVLVTEHTQERSVRPNVGLFYQHRLSENRSLILDGQTSYMSSRMLHEYAENGIGESSRVEGNKYTVKFIGMYEVRNGSRVWSAGVSNNISFIDNTYRQEETVNVRVNQSETAIIGEYTDRFGNWGVRGNVKTAYRHLGQDDKKIDKVFVVPSMDISYRFREGWFVRYSASLDYKMPSAAEISDVEQPIQAGMVRHGNPDLKPFRVTEQAFDISFESRFIGINPRIEYRNENKPIMESVIFKDGGFVRTYFNQRSFERLTVGGAVSLRPWKDHLSIMAEPVLMRYFSHGRDYRHCHNIFRVGLSVDFTYGKWLAYGNIMSGPANYMYGEEIIEEKDMNQIMAGYKRDRWSVHLGVFNAFMKNYWMETRNLSALAPYTSKAHSGRSSSYIAVKFNLSLDFGRKGRDVTVRDDEPDNDSGILTGTK